MPEPTKEELLELWNKTQAQKERDKVRTAARNKATSTLISKYQAEFDALYKEALPDGY